jgi:hypothetical protein
MRRADEPLQQKGVAAVLGAFETEVRVAVFQRLSG